MARIVYDNGLGRYVCEGCGDIVPSEMVTQFRYCPMCGRRITGFESVVRKW